MLVALLLCHAPITRGDVETLAVDSSDGRKLQGKLGECYVLDY
jgi:hypothetical protein